MSDVNLRSCSGPLLNRRGLFAIGVCAAWAGVAGLLPIQVQAAPADPNILELQQEWASIRYQAPASEREKRFEVLAAKAHKLTEGHPGQAEPLVWEGIIVSSLAGEKGGLGALSLAKQAKSLYEAAISINGDALEGSAYNSLGVLYFKVPGWPVGFGDKSKARELLQRALAINPSGIDSNYFYAEFLVETKQPEQAASYLERALQAPPRPGRQVADAGRRDEATALLNKIKSR